MSVSATSRISRRTLATALCVLALGLVPASARARDHHSVLRQYGVHGYMTAGGFFIDEVYGGSEAQDNGLLAGDLIVRGNGDLIRVPDDVAEDLVNSRLGRGAAVFLVRKNRSGRFVQVIANGNAN